MFYEQYLGIYAFSLSSPNWCQVLQWDGVWESSSDTPGWGIVLPLLVLTSDVLTHPQLHFLTFHATDAKKTDTKSWQLIWMTKIFIYLSVWKKTGLKTLHTSSVKNVDLNDQTTDDLRFQSKEKQFSRNNTVVSLPLWDDQTSSSVTPVTTFSNQGIQNTQMDHSRPSRCSNRLFNL